MRRSPYASAQSRESLLSIVRAANSAGLLRDLQANWLSTHPNFASIRFGPFMSVLQAFRRAYRLRVRSPSSARTAMMFAVSRLLALLSPHPIDHMSRNGGYPSGDRMRMRR